MIRSTTILSLALLGASCASGAPTSASSGLGGSGTSASSATSSTAGAGGATGACAACDGLCVDTQNDPRHCGACDHACSGATPLCDHGACSAAPCDVTGPICPLDHLCCGDACCPPWKMCCNTPGKAAPTCEDLDAGACPTTCAGCQ